jgi:hypothetical protein
MISVKCPACGLVDWNVGDCKRCGTSLVGLGAEGGGYFGQTFDGDADGRSVRAARAVVAACAVFALALTSLGLLYLAHRPTKPQWFWSIYRDAPTAAEVFEQNLAASGGRERLSKLHSFRAAGSIFYKGGDVGRATAPVGGNVTFVMHVKEPDKVEWEIGLGDSEQRMQEFTVSNPFAPPPPSIRTTARRGYDGKRGWEYVERTILTPGSTVPIKQNSSRELDGADLAQMKHFSRTTATGLVALAGEYTSLKLVGREAVRVPSASQGEFANLFDKNYDAYVVVGVNRSGKDETLYFDTETGLLVRADYEPEAGEGGGKLECYPQDYKAVDGVKFPHILLYVHGDETIRLSFTEFAPNDPTPDSTFEMPE